MKNYGDFATMFNADEERVLKKIAALQFPGSIRGSYSVFAIMERGGKCSPTTFEDVDDPECGDYRFRSKDNGIAANTATCFVRKSLGLNSSETMDVFTEKARADGRPLFVPYYEAIEHGIPNCATKVNNPADYFQVYGIQPDTVSVSQKEDVWNIQRLTFTRDEATNLCGGMDEDEMLDIRIKPFTGMMGEFPVVMNCLLRLGQKLLDEETAHLSWTEEFRMGPNEVYSMYRENPDVPFKVAQYKLSVPSGLSEWYSEVSFETLTVMASGKILDMKDGTEYPASDMEVILSGGTTKKKRYPFANDAFGSALGSSGGVKTLYNYMRF